MDFNPTPRQQELVERAREFTREWISPNAARYDRSGEFPRDICREAFKRGFMNPHVPKEYGGAAEAVVDHCMVMEELATGCSGIATAIDGNGLSQYPVILAGTDAQKRRFLAPMTEELTFSAYAVTEPEAGSDVSRVRTTAAKVGNDYVLNGVKWWITNGSVASWYFVLARTGETLTGFIVPADSPGIVRGPKEVNLGQHASNTVRVTLEDVKVPEAFRLGDEGKGFDIAMATFNHTRPGVAAGANGITKAALNIALSYAKRRRTFDKKLISNQGISFKLAEMMTRLDAARFLTYKAAWLFDQGIDNAREAAQAKWFAADVAMSAAIECAQVLGGYGYTQEMPAEKLIRDAKIYQIYEGATEIQKMIIVSKLLRMKEVH
ncbi:MAG TPA: acyl-CoA dehydrogenase family protein [Thermoanaerobaculaceae bacterium]|nr:acyl-CoA dehydrogenase family protein [Thermoanaerobaculaceae bacterium]